MGQAGEAHEAEGKRGKEQGYGTASCGSIRIPVAMRSPAATAETPPRMF
jgi:hypothetical protein